MADKQIGIKLDVRQTGLQQVDDGLDSISKNLKDLNEAVIKQQQRGWGSEAQTKEMREQLRYMNQLVQLYERIARTQGRGSDSFGHFRNEIGTMQRDLDSVPSYRTGRMGGWVQDKFGAQAAQNIEKLTQSIGKLGAIYAGFNLYSTLSSGMSRGDQLAFGFGDISKRMNSSNRNALSFGKNLLGSLQGNGYDDLEIMNATRSYTNTTGRLGDNDLKSQMQAILSTGRRYGWDLSQATSVFSDAFSQGVTGGSAAQMNPQQFATLVANATVQAHMQGRESTMTNQLTQLLQTSIQNQGNAASASTAAGLLAIGNATGNQSLIGNLPNMLNSIDQGISNPSGGYGAQALMMRAIGGGKQSFWQEQYQQSLGLFGEDTSYNGKTNIENATDYLLNAFKGDKNRQYVMLGQMFNLKPAQAKQFIDAYTQGGQFKSDALNQLRSQMTNSVPPAITQNDTDINRNKALSEQYGGDKAGMDTNGFRSDTKGFMGSILDSPVGTALALGGSTLSYGIMGYQAYKFAKPFMKKLPLKFLRGGGAAAGTEAAVGGAEAAVGIGGAEAAAGAAAGIGAGEVALGGTAAGLEAAGLAADATGVGLPVGIALGLAGLGVGAYEWFKHGKKKKTNTPSATIQGPPDMTGYSDATTYAPPSGQDLAPIVVSTIMALTPYMSQIKSALGVDSSSPSVKNTPYTGSSSAIASLLGRATPGNNGGVILASAKTPRSIPKSSGGAYSTSTSAADAISYYAQKYGVPEYVAYSIAMAESSLDPNAVADESNGTQSYGLFQLNSNGQGKGYTADQLKDPMTNAKIGLKGIADAYKKAKSLGMEDGSDMAMWVAENSGHPGYGVHSELDDRIRSKAEGLLNGTLKINAGSLEVTIKQPDGSTEKRSVNLTADYTGIQSA